MNKNNQQENQGYKINFDLIDGVNDKPKPQVKQEVYKPKPVPKPKPEVVQNVQPVQPQVQDEPVGQIYNKPRPIPRDLQGGRTKPEGHRGSLQRVIAELKFDKPKYFAPHVSREVVKQKKVKSQAKPQKQYREKSRKFPKLLRVLLWIILAINLAWTVFYAVGKLVYKEALPMIGGVGFVNQTDNSMSPLINSGDLCVVAKQTSYAVDSTIAYENINSEVVVHRFLGMDSKGMCRAKGILSKTIDTPFEREQIKGQVVFTIPFVGFIITPVFNICLILILVGCLIVWYRWRAKRRHT